MKKSPFFESYPKSWVGKSIIYNIMSSHYRRIQNVKPKVETNLAKKKEKVYQNFSKSVKLCGESEIEIVLNKKVLKRKKSFNLEQNKEKHVKYQSDCTFHPKILDSTVKSKLKESLDVYYPPKHHSHCMKHNKESTFPNLNLTVPCQEESPNTAKPSSLDSAYTEGLEDQWSEQQATPQNLKSYTNVQKSSLGSRSFNLIKNGLETNTGSNYGLKKLMKDQIKPNKYKLCRRIMETALEELEIALELSTDDESNNDLIHIYNRTFEEQKNSSQSYVLSASDSYVLSALESLNLDPKLKEDVKNTLGLYPSHNSLQHTDDYSRTENINEMLIESPISIQSSKGHTVSSRDCNVIEPSGTVEKKESHLVLETILVPEKLDCTSERKDEEETDKNSILNKSKKSNSLESVEDINNINSVPLIKSTNSDDESSSSSVSSLEFD